MDESRRESPFRFARYRLDDYDSPVVVEVGTVLVANEPEPVAWMDADLGNQFRRKGVGEENSVILVEGDKPAIKEPVVLRQK